MKTTIKIGASARVEVEPVGKTGNVALTVVAPALIGSKSDLVIMTPDQAGALIFGLEQALEAARIRRAAGFDASAAMAVQGA